MHYFFFQHFISIDVCISINHVNFIILSQNLLLSLSKSVILKLCQPELQFLRSAHRLLMLCIYVNFHVNISNVFALQSGRSNELACCTGCLTRLLLKANIFLTINEMPLHTNFRLYFFSTSFQPYRDNSSHR